MLPVDWLLLDTYVKHAYRAAAARRSTGRLIGKTTRISRGRAIE